RAGVAAIVAATRARRNRRRAHPGPAAAGVLRAVLGEVVVAVLLALLRHPSLRREVRLVAHAGEGEAEARHAAARGVVDRERRADPLQLPIQPFIEGGHPSLLG